MRPSASSATRTKGTTPPSWPCTRTAPPSAGTRRTAPTPATRASGRSRWTGREGRPGKSATTWKPSRGSRCGWWAPSRPSGSTPR
ncbi:hypothetical protein CTRI78_v006765 [Colletotrichum trifolii]|uniref:Uncharacterized protein n=1 Tax=Colletotrichum trifolii TaxID=5466 RepID=A0A4R8RBM2_COLTR|nr:hypothetical protein CTRI78_v006765 [Colletotrichum trifolii]